MVGLVSPRQLLPPPATTEALLSEGKPQRVLPLPNLAWAPKRGPTKTLSPKMAKPHQKKKKWQSQSSPRLGQSRRALSEQRQCLAQLPWPKQESAAPNMA